MKMSFLCSIAISLLIASVTGSATFGQDNPAGKPRDANAPLVLLPTLPDAVPLSEAVLFAFDDRAFPFRDGVETRLLPGQSPEVVLDHGPAGSHDEVLLYYGTVIRIGDTFHMWYNGNHGPELNTFNRERTQCVLCYATSKDGIHWVKPVLGLVEFNGSKNNNIVDLGIPTLWSTGAVLYDPEDKDPSRRFKIAVEAPRRLWVAFSADGLRWKPSPGNPVGPKLEMSGVTKHHGLYYVNGQGAGSPSRANGRRLMTMVSADFEHWSPCGALGLDRSPDVTGPSIDDRRNQNEEVHLGAAMWNRGNVILGIYGQWHGHPTGHRTLVSIDLGLALSHDALHWQEPIRDFKFIPAREQPDGPIGVYPALQQGQGMENVGDHTFYWYSIWRGTEGSGVRMIRWERDRLGMLQPFTAHGARAITCPIEARQGKAKVYVNASGLGEHTQLRVSLLDEGFRPIAGYSGADAAVMTKSELRGALAWKGGNAIVPSQGRVHVEILFEGVRPEDAKLHAMYVGE
jgi:hypothetical protein